MLKIFFNLLLILAIMFGCKKLGYDADPNDEITNGNYLSDTLYAITDSVFKKNDIFTGVSGKFVLGQRDGFEGGFLVYFTFLDTLADIDSVSLEFKTVNSYGADMVDQISAAIYSVDSTWGISANQTNRYRNPPVDIMEFITLGNFKTKDSSTSKISIPLDFENKWNRFGGNSSADTVIFNLFIQPETGTENAVVEVGSYFSEQAPVLIYHKAYEDTTVTDTIPSVAGATIFNYDDISGTALNYPQDMVMVSSGIVYHTLFKFDFSNLPENAIFYRASFELAEDNMNDYENSDNKTSFELRAVESFADTVYNPGNAFTMRSDDGFTATSGASSNAFGEDFIQALSNNYLENEWFEVEFFNEDEDFSVKRFWGVKSSDPMKRPRLIINYLNSSK